MTATGLTTAAPAPAAGQNSLLRLLRLALGTRSMRGRLLLAVLAGAAGCGCGVALLAVSGFLLARASQHPNIVAISIAVVAVRALSVGRGLFRYLERLCSHDVAFRVLADVQVAIYRRLERLAPAGVAAFRSGDLLTRLISDVDATQDLFIRGIVPPLAAVLAGAGATTAVLLILAPAGGVLAAGLLAAGVLVPLVTAASARRAARRAAPARGELGATVTDLLSGAAELHAFGAVEAGLARVRAADAELTRLARRSASASGLGIGLSAAISGLTLWGVLLLGVAATGSGSLGRVPLAVITLTALAAFEVVTALPAAALALGQSRAAADRIAEVLDAPDPVRYPDSPFPAPGRPVEISIRRGTVRYSPDEPEAVRDIDLDLGPGRRVALVGATGAGKSTLAAVLFRFVDLSSGSARLNGRDLAGYDPDDVRAVISGCAQDPHIFDATIRDNLRLARPQASDAELAQAASQARLLDWITSLPRGWDTPAGTRGAALSGGQRQRLALARALLADPALLILDEPTAHLDQENRRALTADLLAATAGRATLLITHELDGLDQVDEIVVLDHGRVAERGTHAQLVRSGGAYYRLWQAGHPGRPA
jgi:thiol reductant ABC exporter CydC subunit